MSFLAVIKRVFPFLLTFAAGLFIASFFVSIAAPNFNGFRRGPSKFRKVQQVRVEVEELRREKCRLQKEVEGLRQERRVIVESKESLDEVDVFTVPPPPPVKLKEMKMKTVEVK